jgi:hypothetical protein
MNSWRVARCQARASSADRIAAAESNKAIRDMAIGSSAIPVAGSFGRRSVDFNSPSDEARRALDERMEMSRPRVAAFGWECPRACSQRRLAGR